MIESNRRLPHVHVGPYGDHVGFAADYPAGSREDDWSEIEALLAQPTTPRDTSPTVTPRSQPAIAGVAIVVLIGVGLASVPTQPLAPDCYRAAGNGCGGAPTLVVAAPERDARAIPAVPEKRLAFSPDTGRGATLAEGRSVVNSDSRAAPLLTVGPAARRD